MENEFLNYMIVLITWGNFGDIHRASNYCFIHSWCPSIGTIVLYQGMKRHIFTKKEAKQFIDEMDNQSLQEE